MPVVLLFPEFFFVSTQRPSEDAESAFLLQKWTF